VWVSTTISTTEQIFCIRQILENTWKYSTSAIHRLEESLRFIKTEVSCYILIESGVHVTLARHIKTCLV
jgi:hypothetical protein